MVAIVGSLVGAVILYGALLLLFRTPKALLPKPEARCIVSNWPAGLVGKRYR